jgi:RNA polymerase sigma-70 factor (TIGR02943 family)
MRWRKRWRIEEMPVEYRSMSDEKPQTSGDRTDPALWVEKHGDCLFRYALLRLGSADAAEDVVQETFLAALGSRQSFAERASERSWLIGILKHKLADHCRRQQPQNPPIDFRTGDETVEELFDARGRWRLRPLPGPDDPGALLERQEFWETFRDCLAKLPARLASAFALREVDGLPADEVRSLLGVSANNLWVLLHRARLGLGRCLDVNWFRGERAGE